MIDMSWKEIVKAKNPMKDEPYYFLSNRDEIHTKPDKSMGLNIAIKRGISFDHLKGVGTSVSFKNNARDWDSVYRETMNYIKENPFLLNLEELKVGENNIPVWKIEEKTLFVPIGYLDENREMYLLKNMELKLNHLESHILNQQEMFNDFWGNKCRRD